MPRIQRNVHELISRIIAARSVGASRRALIAEGANAVEPILEALAGDHGRFETGSDHDPVNVLLDTLVEIAKRDHRPLAEALAHDVPSLNAVVWALGHSTSRQARAILKDHADHEDGAIRDIAEHHLGRGRRARRAKKKAVRRKAKKKATRKKKAAKKKAAKRKKKAAKRRTKR